MCDCKSKCDSCKCDDPCKSKSCNKCEAPCGDSCSKVCYGKRELIVKTLCAKKSVVEDSIIRSCGSANFGQARATLTFDPILPASLTLNGVSSLVTVTVSGTAITSGGISFPITISNTAVKTISVIFAQVSDYSGFAGLSPSSTSAATPVAFVSNIVDGAFDVQIVNSGLDDILVGQTFKISFLVV